MLEGGLISRGDSLVDVKAYDLEEWKEAFDTTADFTGVGGLMVITL